MKNFAIVVLLSAMIPSTYAETTTDIPPSQSRASTLMFAHKLTDTVKITVVPTPEADFAALKNPFNLEQTASGSALTTGGVESSVVVPVEVAMRGKLEAMAAQVTPSGTFQIGGISILLFGQKKLKVGDHLPILFDGQSYELEISNIQSTNFTIRLGGEEVTRSIKSVIKPKS